MKKKIISLMLAATMVMASAMTVCAEDATIEENENLSAGQEITGSSEMELPKIKVTVPTDANIVINPFKMAYKFNEGDATSYTNQIISAEQSITNESDVAILVNVSELTIAKDSLSEGVLISAKDITAKDTTKLAFLYLEVIGADTEGKYTFGTAYDSKNTQQLVIPNAANDSSGKTKAAEKAAIVTLGAGSTTPTVAKFKIGGSVVTNPTVEGEDDVITDAPWTATDTIGVSWKFTFTPQANEEKESSTPTS